MSSLLQQQQTFCENTGRLIVWTYGQGYQLTWGEAMRDPRIAQLNAQAGIGIVATLHGERLAIDLNLFLNGVLLGTTKDYAPLGAYWKTLNPLNRWGGDFKAADGSPKPDSDHFSMEFGGIK